MQQGWCSRAWVTRSLGLGLGQIGAGIYGAKQAGKSKQAQIEAGNYAAQLKKNPPMLN